MKSEKLVYLSGAGLLIAAVSLAVGIGVGARLESHSADERTKAIQRSSDLHAERRGLAHQEAVALVAEWRKHQSDDEFLSKLEAWEANHADLGDDVSWWSNEARLMVTANLQQKQISLLGEANEISMKTLKAIQPQLEEARRHMALRADLDKAIQLLDEATGKGGNLPSGMERVPASSGR